MSQVLTNFVAAANASDWPTAYRNLNGLNMYEMLRGLADLKPEVLDKVWEQSDNFDKMYGIPRIEYAVLVVKTRKLPATAPGDLQTTGQVQDAKDFLREYAKRRAVGEAARNLVYSHAACKFVLAGVKMKGGNWDAYTPGRPSYEHDGAAYKDALDVCVYDTVRPEYGARLGSAALMIQKIRLISNSARAHACGNCGEFSASAFMYLYDLGVRPIDWMSLVGGDHAFVVIGRVKGSGESDWQKWGDAAAVCDPWGQGFRGGDTKTGTYLAKTFGPQMRGLLPFTGVKSLHREE